MLTKAVHFLLRFWRRPEPTHSIACLDQPPNLEIIAEETARQRIKSAE
jgi:hypothetical protein